MENVNIKKLKPCCNQEKCKRIRNDSVHTALPDVFIEKTRTNLNIWMPTASVDMVARFNLRLRT